MDTGIMAAYLISPTYVEIFLTCVKLCITYSYKFCQNYLFGRNVPPFENWLKLVMRTGWM